MPRLLTELCHWGPRGELFIDCVWGHKYCLYVGSETPQESR